MYKATFTLEIDDIRKVATDAILEQAKENGGFIQFYYLNVFKAIFNSMGNGAIEYPIAKIESDGSIICTEEGEVWDNGYIIQEDDEEVEICACMSIGEMEISSLCELADCVCGDTSFVDDLNNVKEECLQRYSSFQLPVEFKRGQVETNICDEYGEFEWESILRADKNEVVDESGLSHALSDFQIDDLCGMVDKMTIAIAEKNAKK